MFAIDVGPSPSVEQVSRPATVETRAAAKSGRADHSPLVGKYDAVLGACQLVEPDSPSESAINGIAPVGQVLYFLKLEDTANLKNPMKVTVLEAPRFGTLERVQPFNDEEPESAPYHYQANNLSYRGKDRFSFAVELEDKHFKLVYEVLVVQPIEDYEVPGTIGYEFCPTPWKTWRIK